MLAARGVSLGIGKELINLSGLNQLSAADKALLGRIDKRKKEADRQKPKYIIKKHIDSKTLWIACVTVIAGSFVMLFGLLATVTGYFDEEIGKNVFSLPDQSANDQNGVSEKQIAFRHKLAWLLLKSLQYLGPIITGIGMFSLIMACVLTLESRDRHTSIIEQQSAAALSRPNTKQQSREPSITMYKWKKTVDSVNVQTVVVEEANNSNAQESDGRIVSNGLLTASNAKNFITEVSGDKANDSKTKKLQSSSDEDMESSKNNTTVSFCINITEDRTSPDIMCEYTFHEFGRGECSLEDGRLCKNEIVVSNNDHIASVKQPHLYAAKSKDNRMLAIDDISTTSSEQIRHKDEQLAIVNKLINVRGPAPIVREDSIIEFLSNDLEKTQ